MVKINIKFKSVKKNGRAIAVAAILQLSWKGFPIHWNVLKTVFYYEKFQEHVFSCQYIDKRSVPTSHAKDDYWPTTFHSSSVDDISFE